MWQGLPFLRCSGSRGRGAFPRAALGVLADYDVLEVEISVKAGQSQEEMSFGHYQMQIDFSAPPRPWEIEEYGMVGDLRLVQKP